jgi:hypothetical protein
VIRAVTESEAEAAVGRGGEVGGGCGAAAEDKGRTCSLPIAEARETAEKHLTSSFSLYTRIGLLGGNKPG